METATFFEKAEDELNDISQQMSHGSDVSFKEYIYVLNNCQNRIKALKV